MNWLFWYQIKLISKQKKLPKSDRDIIQCLKGSINQYNTAILNVNIPNNTAAKYVKQKLIDFLQKQTIPQVYLETSTPLNQQLLVYLDKKSARINKNSTLPVTNNIINIYRTLYPTAAEYTFFSSVHRTYAKIDLILAHKMNLNKFKRIKII